MSPKIGSEESTVQIPLARYAKKLGWRDISSSEAIVMWWLNQQKLAMGCYIRSKGDGQHPLARYRNTTLLNKIIISRTDEVVQMWNALALLSGEVISEDINEGLTRRQQKTAEARKIYNELPVHGFSERHEGNMEYLTALSDSLAVFSEMAEL
jgi:hypothetical protein